MRIRTMFSSLIVCGALAACSPTTYEDETLYLTGTEEGFLLREGQKVCAGKKELICHIPPGNPANAHTICVSKNAVDTHVGHHNDTIGPCVTEPTPPPEEPPPPDEPPDEPPPPVDAGTPDDPPADAPGPVFE